MDNQSTNHGERTHSKISPSGLKNFEVCPGYVREDEEGKQLHPVTAEGTLIHEALDQGDDSHLTQDQKDLYEYCEVYANLLPTSYGTIIKEPKVEVFMGVYGHVDQVQILGDEADVLDWKMGWNRVDPADRNSQGQAYTLGVFNAYPNLRQVTVHFVQPRLGYVTSHTYTREDVPDLEYRIRAVVSAVANATPDDYRPCPSNCAYCARHDCPAVAAPAYEIAKGYAAGKDRRLKAEAILRGEPEPESLLATLPTEFYPRAMSDPEQISRALDIVPVVQSWAGSVLSRAKQMRVKEGIEIPGWEIAYRSGRKSVTNSVGAYESAKDRVSAEDFITACTVSLTQLKELYTETSQRGKKAADARALEARLVDRDALSGGGEEIPYLKRTKK